MTVKKCYLLTPYSLSLMLSSLYSANSYRFWKVIMSYPPQNTRVGVTSGSPTSAEHGTTLSRSALCGPSAMCARRRTSRTAICLGCQGEGVRAALEDEAAPEAATRRPYGDASSNDDDDDDTERADQSTGGSRRRRPRDNITKLYFR